jgi:hypothetical protein
LSTALGGALLFASSIAFPTDANAQWRHHYRPHIMMHYAPPRYAVHHRHHYFRRHVVIHRWYYRRVYWH